MTDYYLAYYEFDPATTKRTPPNKVKVELSDLELLISGSAASSNCPPAADRAFVISSASGPPDRYCFLRKSDVSKFLAFAEKESVYVSVRNTGAESIARLGESGHGYACKPHQILEKTLKGKSVAKCEAGVVQALADIARASSGRGFTVTLKCMPAEQDNAWWQKALPGLTTGTPGTATAAAGVNAVLNYVLNTLLPLAKDPRFTGFVGWWVSIKLTATRTDGEPVFKRDATEAVPSLTEVVLNIPAGVLYVGEKAANEDAKQPLGEARHFADVHTQSDLPLDSYTGDYDLHCVYSKAAYYTDDSRAVQGATRSVSADDEKGRLSQQGVLGHLYWQLVKRDGYLYRTRDIVPYQQGRVAGPARDANDRYANLIQHGAQGQYLNYVDTHNNFDTKRLQAKMEGANLEDEQIAAGLLKVDGDGVLAFTPVKTVERVATQEVHLLRGTADVLAYYRHNGLASDPFSKGRLPDLVAARSLAAPLRRLYDAEIIDRGNSIAYTLTGSQGGLSGTDDSFVVLNKILSTTAISPEVERLSQRDVEPKYSIAADSGRFRHVQEPFYFYDTGEAGTRTIQVIAATKMFPPLSDVIVWELYHDNEMDDEALPSTAPAGYAAIVVFKKSMSADEGSFVDDLRDYPTTFNSSGWPSSGWTHGFECTCKTGPNSGQKQLVVYKA